MNLVLKSNFFSALFPQRFGLPECMVLISLLKESRINLYKSQVLFLSIFAPAFYVQPLPGLSFSGAKLIHLSIGSQFRLLQNYLTSQFVNVILCEKPPPISQQLLSDQLDLELKFSCCCSLFFGAYHYQHW